MLGWVVREAVTNVVRHGREVTRCEISVEAEVERVRVRVLDDGTGDADGDGCGTPEGATFEGTGLRGLAERLAVAGGRLTAGTAGARGGFVVTAELPVGVDAGDGEAAVVAPGDSVRSAGPSSEMAAAPTAP